jgi:hypothetical protein
MLLDQHELQNVQANMMDVESVGAQDDYEFEDNDTHPGRGQQ